MTVYSTADSRLAAYFLLNNVTFAGTETRLQDGDHRVMLRFTIEESDLARLKREFFESEKWPALEFANAMKRTMFIVREARELARESLK